MNGRGAQLIRLPFTAFTCREEDLATETCIESNVIDIEKYNVSIDYSVPEYHNIA